MVRTWVRGLETLVDCYFEVCLRPTFVWVSLCERDIPTSGLSQVRLFHGRPRFESNPSLPEIAEAGNVPVGHGVRSLPSERLSKSHATLPEVFKKNGYHTYAEVTEHLESAGLDRGFDSYNHRDTKQTIHSQWGNDLVRRLRNGELKEPYFLFVHLFGLHAPRAVPRAFRSSRLGATQYETGKPDHTSMIRIHLCT